MKTELLIVVPGNDSFCDDKESFIKFLKIDSQIHISNSNISYKRAGNDEVVVTARFHVETEKVKSKQERYFLIVLECVNEELINEFSEFCGKIKLICERISPNSTAINTLWDDVGHIYAKTSYPIINEVENLMRKLIAKFMLITVGMSWSKDAIQPELFKKIENFEGEQPLLNDLHKLDFIQLNQVLFAKKRDISPEEVDRILAKTKFSEDDREKLLKFVPRSNWEKYFSSLIDEKDSSLEKKWKLLYELRNKVAHNRHLSKSDFESIQGLSKDIKDTVIKAIAKLGEIDLTEKDRELIIHTYNSESLSIGYIAEKSVADFYIKHDYEVSLLGGVPSDQYGFDFIGDKNGKKIGVETVVLSPRNFHSYITLIESRARRKESIMNSSYGILEVMHLIFIIAVDYSDYQLGRMMHLAEKFSSILGKGYEIYLGELNENNEYVPVAEVLYFDSSDAGAAGE